MTKPKGEPKSGKRLYELVEERRPRQRRGVDSLDEVLIAEERELVQEHKRLRLEQLIGKRRREVEKMREGIVDRGTLPSNADFLNMAKALEDLSPEEAQRVRSSYTFFKMAEKGGSGGMALMPMLLNYAKTNPGASENQMINYLKLMDSQLMKGLEIAKAMNPPKQQGDPMTYMVKGMEIMKTANPSKQDNPMEFLKLMKDLVIEGVRNPLMQAIKESQPQPGVLEQVLMKPELFNRMKDIGIFAGRDQKGASNEMDLKIEQLRGERDMMNRKYDLENRRMLLEMESKERRTDTMLGLIGPLSAMFAGPVDERMRQMGRQTAGPPRPALHTTPNPGPSPTMLTINCDKCGYKEDKALMGPPPATVICPKCNNEMNIVPGAPLGGT